MLTPLARLTAILARTPGIPDSTPLTMGGEVELELTLGDLRWLVEQVSKLETIEPRLSIQFRVVAYDEGGYGDNRSADFVSEAEAVAYALGLETRFHPSVSKVTTMSTIWELIDFKETPHGAM